MDIHWKHFVRCAYCGHERKNGWFHPHEREMRFERDQYGIATGCLGCFGWLYCTDCEEMYPAPGLSYEFLDRKGEMNPVYSRAFQKFAVESVR